MRQFVFYLNLILTIVALIPVFIENVVGYNLDSSDGFLMLLGFFQVFIAFTLTFYAIANDRLLLLLLIIYWFIVTLFFKFFIKDFIYISLLIALYNLYINYCSFSNSKFNILNK
ncbi:hypothetical protein GCM10028861_14910 [Flavobacterium koreense]